MKCENINIKKLQKFAILYKKLDWRKIEHKKIVKVDMQLQEFFQRREKQGSYFYESVKIKDGGTHDKNHPNYLTQIVSVECKIDTRHAHRRMKAFLEKAFDMKLEFDGRSSFYGFYHNILLGFCKYFCQNKNIKDFTTFSYEIKEVNKSYNEVAKILCVSFANSNFKLELEIIS